MALSDTKLPDLLGDALVEPSGPAYAQENKVVEQLRESLAVSQAVLLVGYTYGVPEVSAEAAALVAEAGEAHMDAFGGGDNLSRRFAAAAVIDLMQDYRGRSPVAAALAARAAAITGLSPVVAVLTPVAAASLSRLAEAMRGFTFEQPSVQPFPAGKSGELPPEGAGPVTSTELRALVHTERAVIRAAAVNAEKRIGQLELLTRRNSEEIDLLWWALDPFSDHVDEWSQAGDPATLVAALEAGRRLLIEPPPRGVRRVLAGALAAAGVDPTEQLGLNEVADEAPTDVLTDPAVSGNQMSWAIPVLSWLRERRDGGDVAGGGEVIASRLDWAAQLVSDLSLERLLTETSTGRRR